MSLGGSQCPTFADGVYISVGIPKSHQATRIVVQAGHKSPKCGNNNEPLDKGAAVLILAELLKTE